MQVTLAQKKGQAIRIASRCLWDASNDTYASFVHENQSLICNCQVNICSHSLLLRAAGFLVQWTVRRSTACTLSRATALAVTAASDTRSHVSCHALWSTMNWTIPWLDLKADCFVRLPESCIYPIDTLSSSSSSRP